MTEAAEGRILTLDIVRGVAVMGILAMNIVAFAMPEQAYMNPLAFGTEGIADRISWLFSFIAVDGKMRGLFSLLFGASMLLVIERADASGAASDRIHFARMAWLLLFGLLHHYLIWWGDILSLYASIGMIAWLFAYRSPGTLVRWGVALILIQTLLFALLAASTWQASLAAETGSIEAVRSFAIVRSDFEIVDDRQLADILALYRGDHAGIVHHQLTEELFTPLTSLIMLGWETLGYMLLGMAGLKSGFLTGAWDDACYRRIAAGCIAAGIAGYGLLGWGQLANGFSVTAILMLGLAATTPLRPVMVIGVAALVILLARRGGPLAQRIGAAGRAAFTNYLGTSLLMTALFYGWGFGWFGTLSRAELWLVVLPMWALMLLWSKPWLDRWRYGPFEWLWRSLARGRLQPMVKQLIRASA